MKYPLLITTIVFALSSCKHTRTQESNLSVEDLYDQGISNLENSDYKEAIENFSKVFYKNPSHKLTAQSEVMHAYSLYKKEEYDDVIDVVDIFLNLHPRHPEAAYMRYLKALSYYVQISDIKLDQESSQHALSSLKEVMDKHPGSKYAIDSAKKFDSVLDHLAGKEVLIGTYYLKNKNPIAAIKRFQKVLSDYSSTPHMPESLYRLVEANLAIGLKNEAVKYQKILMEKYRETQWFEFSQQLLPLPTIVI
ncbi:MAG TPA: outer membrane protein assembly factor BamD [Candidatus Megaira endosymbiont of Nemacystus decipiens]|nr:outer membrane protein assembly factor BamD [Candidatus Megaera endosymbiont of Nemacystus decipiens]